MAQTPLSHDAAQKAVDAWREAKYSSAGAARLLGIPEASFRNRLKVAKSYGLVSSTNAVDAIKKGDPTFSETVKYRQDYTGRLETKIESGHVIIASDCHYWPNIITPAHKALIKLTRDLKPKLLCLNGDVFDGASVSRHASIGWEEKPKVTEELEACRDRLDELQEACPQAKKIWTLGNHDCLDAQTECLTKRGWLKYTDLKKDDLILSYVNGGVEWSNINEIVVYPFNGNLVRIEKTRMSMAVTENHRVLLRRLNWRTRLFDIEEYRQANDLPYNFDVPVTGYINNKEYAIEDWKIELTGWILTDGNFAKNAVNLYQSKIIGRNKIEEVLKKSGYKFSVYLRQRKKKAICGRELIKEPLQSAQYAISAEDSRKIKEYVPVRGIIPNWAYELSSRQFDILLNAIVDGDGVWDGYQPAKKTCCVIYGTEQILSSIQSVAILHGWRARLAIDNRGNYRLCLTKENKLRIEKNDIFKEKYSGNVWCLKVPHTNFMVRRNGAAYFTGNCRFETRLANQAPEYARVHGVHLRDHFPRWQPCWSLFINDCTVIKHRFKGGIHATHNNTLTAGKTMVTGHLHSLKVTPYTDYNGTRYGVDTGTLASAEPVGPQFVNYLEDNPVNWRSGFVVLTYHKGKLLWPEVCAVVDKNHVQFRGQIIRV